MKFKLHPLYRTAAFILLTSAAAVLLFTSCSEPETAENRRMDSDDTKLSFLSMPGVVQTEDPEDWEIGTYG